MCPTTEMPLDASEARHHVGAVFELHEEVALDQAAHPLDGHARPGGALVQVVGVDGRQEHALGRPEAMRLQHGRGVRRHSAAPPRAGRSQAPARAGCATRRGRPSHGVRALARSHPTSGGVDDYLGDMLAGYDGGVRRCSPELAGSGRR